MRDAPELPLGKPTDYPEAYDPGLLVAVDRALNRASLATPAPLPFDGEDRWTAFEVSWLDARGVPTAAIAELVVPARSPRLCESKSLKLYLGSLNGARFASADAAAGTIAADLGRATGAAVEVALWGPERWDAWGPGALPGRCIDGAPIEGPSFVLDAGILDGAADASREVSEAVLSHLFRSRCPITAQPDWASVWIRYRGPAIDDGRLLRYLLSFRDHGEFHEHCVERIFADLWTRCGPRALTVAARFTRRGGLDINPWRASAGEAPPALPRLVRQ